MQNTSGQLVDLYVPRKCSWTHRLIAADDRGAVQFRVAKLDPKTGIMIKGQYHHVSLSGALRSKGEADQAVTALDKASFA